MTSSVLDISLSQFHWCNLERKHGICQDDLVSSQLRYYEGYFAQQQLDACSGNSKNCVLILKIEN